MMLSVLKYESNIEWSSLVTNGPLVDHLADDFARPTVLCDSILCTLGVSFIANLNHCVFN